MGSHCLENGIPNSADMTLASKNFSLVRYIGKLFIGAVAGSVRNPVTIGLMTAAGEAETAGDDGSNSAGVGLTVQPISSNLTKSTWETRKARRQQV